MAAKVFATEPKGKSSVPGNHKMEGEKQSSKLTSIGRYALPHTTPMDISRYIFEFYSCINSCTEHFTFAFCSTRWFISELKMGPFNVVCQFACQWGWHHSKSQILQKKIICEKVSAIFPMALNINVMFYAFPRFYGICYMVKHIPWKKFKQRKLREQMKAGSTHRAPPFKCWEAAKSRWG